MTADEHQLVLDRLMDAQQRLLDDILEQLRPTSFAIAYRMLGSVSEAEQRAALLLHDVFD